LSKRSFHKVVRYHHPSNDKDILWANHGVSQLLNSTSEGPESTRTCTLSKMRLVSTINASLQTAAGRTKNMGDTISRSAHIMVSTLGSDESPKE
jgi:hypothetical protein